MYTDWILIRRAAAELDARFRGARVRDVGVLSDGRLGLVLWKRGEESLVCADLFAPTPLVTVENGDLPVAAEPGFVRAANVALQGTTLTAVRARRGDRIIRFECGSRSRFGVESAASLILELIPKFGNAILIKGDVVVSALKEFGRADNPVRAVQSGGPYEPPPLPEARLTPEEAVRTIEASGDAKERVRALRGAEPLVPQQIAESLACAAHAAPALLQRAHDIVERYRAEDVAADPIFAYYRSGALVQAHVVPLDQYGALQCERSERLIPLFAQARETRTAASLHDKLEKRRRDMLRSLSERETKLQTERERALQKLSTAAERESLRMQGEEIYAGLYAVPEAERDERKERAASLFAKYKKLGLSVEHLKRRLDDIAAELESIAELRWETERARADDLDDVAQAVASLDPRAQKRQHKTVQARRRKPLQIVTQNGSRIFVGRTPVENADLTFRVARPDDLWFHVQNQPGAHVILQRDDRTPALDEDILAAAQLAAFHSKAKTSPKVTVDYTLRKYVRKRPSAAPGLVFYTNPKSVIVTPGDGATR